MIDYRAGTWGFSVSIGYHGSLGPRALTMAIPNAILTLLMALWWDDETRDGTDSYRSWFRYDSKDRDWEKTGENALKVIAAFTATLVFILYNRSRTSYNRWWEGGTLLQKMRGEWFNAYSSILAMTSTKPELQHQVDEYTHLLARLMSLLMCCGLQQVSPHRDRPFPILDLDGIEPESIEFLNQAPDKVEIILQWLQRSIVLNISTGVLPTPPPILSRAFQEFSRGIVNLQNARKIADFPYPFPLAQVSMILQLLHWAMLPVVLPLAMPKGWAVLFAFFSIFALWCIHFNALDLEFPFGDRENDLPMKEFQQDWNHSVRTLLDKRATKPPAFVYVHDVHNDIQTMMSDASKVPKEKIVRTRGQATISLRSQLGPIPLDADEDEDDSLPIGDMKMTVIDADVRGSSRRISDISDPKPADVRGSSRTISDTSGPNSADVRGSSRRISDTSGPNSADVRGSSRRISEPEEKRKPESPEDQKAQKAEKNGEQHASPKESESGGHRDNSSDQKKMLANGEQQVSLRESGSGGDRATTSDHATLVVHEPRRPKDRLKPIPPPNAPNAWT